MEEDAVAAATLEVRGRGGASRKRGATDDEEEEAMSNGEENEREALRCLIVGEPKRAAGRQCRQCRGPCRAEQSHFDPVEQGNEVPWSRSRWECSPRIW